MNIRNCRNCGRIYNYIVGPNVCPACKSKLEDKFQEVKKYIYDHPGVNISEVSDETEVSIQQLREWVREERLEFTADSVTGVVCDNCGKPIRSGKYCNKCKEEMIHTLGSAYEHGNNELQSEDKKNPKMRYFR